ncbi:hypothetical protein ARMGADRAFT_1090375 [Armillaria gallica]|uniref:Uncharacterized protein n=1 Tax=Armillaria gallica TaxID=47427 RepID=A0A2H3CKB7_ARMGA|nr:hypothetical protein ARMGADRAFT_1090375 [Armillaria gallica]
MLNLSPTAKSATLDLGLTEFWLATSDPVSSDTDTGPSDEEGNDDEDVGYGAAERPASPMEVDPASPEGEPSRDETGEEWRGASETRADSAAVQAAATLAALVAYGASSDDGSGEDEGEVEEGNDGEVEEEEDGEVEEEEDGEVEEEVRPKRKSSADRKEEEKDCDADDEREEEEVDKLEGGGASDAAPALKKKGYTHTGWPADLNQRLRQGKTQPAMRAYMVEMEEEGVLEQMRSVADAMAGVVASCPHGCPNRVARATPAKKKATRSDKGKGKAGPAPVKRPQAFVLVPRLKPNSHPPAAGEPTQPEVGPSNMPTPLDFMVEFQSFRSCPMQERPPAGHNPVTDFAFNLAEHCLGGMTHPREAAWDWILALMHQLIAAHRALEYKLRRSGPFSAEVEYLLQTRYPDSMLPPDEEQNEGSAEGKGNT